MLLAVEGGGFFSSSASGYSHGLALLLLGRKGEEKHDKGSTCSHYRLVGQEAEHECQAPSGKNDVPGKCASFICFGCTPARLVGASPPKLGSSNAPGSSSEQPSSSSTGTATTNGSINGSGIKGCLKNNLKRDSSECSTLSCSEEPRESLEEVQTLRSGVERRKVQWTDTYGKELFEIREFEVSDDGLSEDDLENDGFRKCECVIQ
ncbi:hypothetical protein SEVIR_3G125500v4 [Setaria viridis]|uniref:Uncharacterized protein n=1 Tax=Setaria viridis TaxID=4556 RepID=A0A4U6V8M2_SETVI|nr:uncharacterized protein LOC117846956 [Setaria viridis]XP_034583976.1 uncharacterized protein LOC117846956 [Setaria viridis]TKW25538.1 hypothetical protein SEVIR_3G125500v2 [Setaria viridis]TKW25539.1 hypothetical protein SEVIR_3G125500v2 [Setaria viridis]